MSLIVHTADVHLDSPLAGLPHYEGAPKDDLRLATRRALMNVVDLALEEGADMVIVAGDLYDGDLRDANTALFLCAELERLRRDEIEVVIAYGNHDAESVVTRRLPLPDGVTVLPTGRAGTASFPRLGIAVHGQGYDRRDISKDLSAAYPAPVDGLQKSRRGGSPRRSRRTCTPPADVERGEAADEVAQRSNKGGLTTLAVNPAQLLAEVAEVFAHERDVRVGGHSAEATARRRRRQLATRFVRRWSRVPLASVGGDVLARRAACARLVSIARAYVLLGGSGETTSETLGEL